MMEYAKVILPVVSDWKELFRKELIKCLNWLDTEEDTEFYRWCNEMFSDDYPEIIGRSFCRCCKEK